jgi:Tol biopolymer transport system component
MTRRALVSALLLALTMVANVFALAPSSAAHDEVPEGTVAYTTTIDGHEAIFVVDPAAVSDPRSMVDLGDRDASQPAWSFDGARIAFTAQMSPGGSTAIFVADADGSGVRQVTFPDTGMSDSDASWSPGGDEIVFARTLSTGLSRIFVVDVGTLDLRALDDPSLPTATEPDWSPEGSRIAFVAKESVDESVCESTPSACRWGLFVVNADGTGAPQRIGQAGWDYHDPDWSADGRKIAASFGLDADPSFSLIVAIAVRTGGGSYQSGSGSLSEPSWSPYGHGIVVRLGTGADSGIVLYDEALGQVTQLLVFPGSAPSWGASPSIPPIQPPPYETTPPTIELSMVTNEQGWLQDPQVQVVAEDTAGVDELWCTLDGQLIQVDWASLGSSKLGGSLWFYDVAEGQHDLRCTAADRWGNVASSSATVNVDFTPPVLGAISFSPQVRRVDQTTTVTIPFIERGSGMSAATVQLGSGTDGPTFPMSVSDSTLRGTIGPSVPAGIWGLSASAVDNNGNRSSRTYFADFLIVYDPSAGSANGTGWIVPGGSTSNMSDYLPGGVDGTTKANFSFKTLYKSATSTTPTGFFNLSYGSQFKLQSDHLDWLVVETSTAVFQGIATIKDLPGTWTFQAAVQDGDSTGGADRLELRVWPVGANPFRESPQFQSTGDASGQIQIQQ